MGSSAWMHSFALAAAVFFAQSTLSHSASLSGILGSSEEFLQNTGHAMRRLLQTPALPSNIVQSPLPGYTYAWTPRGTGWHAIYDEATLHWANEPATSTLPAGVSFALEAQPNPAEDADDGHAHDPVARGWAGLGWSQAAKPSAPPQMINATAVLGYIDANDQPVVDTYDLRSKNVFDIIPGPRYRFTVTNTSVEITSDQRLIVRFRRSFDATFTNTDEQSMIMALCNAFKGLQRHNYRSGIKILFSEPPTARNAKLRLDSRRMQAHAWMMFTAWGIILPLGIIVARYFRDDYGRWYMVHLGLQVTGLIVLICAISIPWASNKPIPKNFRHYQLGIAVFLMALLQPFSAVPRFMTHHGYQVTSLLWAYLHWTVGRAALVFAFVNMFLGIGRFRTWFTLGSWAEAALGCYIGGLILVCLALEARLWRKSDLRARREWDEVSQRISTLEDPGRKDKIQLDADDDLLDQGHPADDPHFEQPYSVNSHNTQLSDRSKAAVHDHDYI